LSQSEKLFSFFETCQYYFMISQGEYIFSLTATKKRRIRNDTIRWHDIFQDAEKAMRLKITEDFRTTKKGHICKTILSKNASSFKISLQNYIFKKFFN